MTVLALAIGDAEFTASAVAAGIGASDIRRIPVPAAAKWNACRDLLLEIAGDDEITAIGIACPNPSDLPAAAVRRMFPVAIVQVATRELCRLLAERSLGPVAGPEVVLAGAGILALLAEERAPRGPSRPTTFTTEPRATPRPTRRALACTHRHR
ncbi:hypothetical protein [Nocardia wallacei]|uniref:hypothetical protein n=1 Tax=Nocardia wallacei TaxID=480035 RepID=UPI002458EC6B|nr:hypothetical protein [Nocardia wallacei]